ncbi:MAG: glycosyltransferase family 87 protein [Bacteroidetes bacterium]|nr:glycosyltransferase family 87 protein [Bacteroidota bacterium]
MGKLKNLVFVLYLLALIFVVGRNLVLPWGDLFHTGGHYSHYNNYIIFKNSFWHLIHGQNLYAEYPLDQYDVFKYTPTFAVLFAPFSAIPDFLGYPLWTALNLLFPLWALFQIGGISPKYKPWIGIVLLLEAITSSLNSQSNGLLLGLFFMALASLERQHYAKAMIWIWLTVFIKLFGLVFFVVLALYPNAIRRSFIPGLVVLAALVFLPMPIVGWQYIQLQYHNLFDLLANDHAHFVKLSMMAWIKQWFHLVPEKNTVLFLGLFIQLLPLLFWRTMQTKKSMRMVYAGSWLLWMVIFNHMAESATYVIAVGGAMLVLSQMGFIKSNDFDSAENTQLHDVQNKKIDSNTQSNNPVQNFSWRRYLRFQNSPWILAFIMIFLFTMLGPTDVYPKSLRLWIVETAQLKAFPCIYLWGLVLLKMLKTVRH